MPRLLLLHGYTEDARTFAPLRPLLPGYLDLEDVALEEALGGSWPARVPVHAGTVAGRLAQHHRIGPADVVLGHSMGGWLAAHVKAQTGATAILLSGFTDQRKIVSDIRHLGVLRLLVGSGLLQSRWMAGRFKRDYPYDESRAVHAQLTDDTARIDRRYLYRQLRVLFAPAPPLSAAPDLRLHAPQDNIIRPPDEPYVWIPGDHFSHVVYPQPTADAVRAFLESRAAERSAAEVYRRFSTPSSP